MPVYRLIEEGLVPGENFIQVGLRGYYPDTEAFEWMKENNFRYHTMAEIERRGWDAVMEDVIKEAFLRELERNGQVFFLHNRVKTINQTAAELLARHRIDDDVVDLSQRRRKGGRADDALRTYEKALEFANTEEAEGISAKAEALRSLTLEDENENQR